MSVFSALWHKITNGSDEKDRLEIAIVAGFPSETMTHYIERLEAFLKVMTPLPVQVTVYNNLGAKPEKINAFLKKHEKRNFDGVIALGALCGQMLVRATRRIGSSVPLLVLGYQELLSPNIPRNVAGFFFPDDSATIFHVFRKLDRNLSKILIVSVAGACSKVIAIKSLMGRFRDVGIEVGVIYVDHPSLTVEEQFFQQKDGAQMMFTTFDARVFEHTQKLADLAHNNGLLMVGGNLHAIHDDVDLVIGYPETKVFRFVVHKLMMMLHGSSAPSDTFRISHELHCNAQNLIKHKSVLENISTFFVEGDMSVHIHANKKALR